MQGEALLIGLGTFGVGIAGFSAVAAALRQGNPNWTPGHSLRARAIVSTSLNVAFESILPVIASYGIHDERIAIVVPSLIAGAYLLIFVLVPRTRQFIRTGALHGLATWLTVFAGYLVVTLLLANALLQSVAVYAMALWVQLTIPAVTFYSLVAEADRK